MTDKKQPQQPQSPPQSTQATLSSRFPTAYTILFLLIVFVAALTWIIPAGKYDRVMSEEVGREVAVPGTYQVVEAKPQGFVGCGAVCIVSRWFFRGDECHGRH